MPRELPHLGRETAHVHLRIAVGLPHVDGRVLVAGHEPLARGAEGHGENRVARVEDALVAVGRMMDDDLRARGHGQRRAAHDPREIGHGFLQLQRLARRRAPFIPERDLPPRADRKQMPALADRFRAPRQMLGPHRARLVLDEDLALDRVPQLPLAVASRRRERLAVGPPGEGIAAVLVCVLQNMQRLAGGDIVNRDLPGDRTGGEPRTIRRPREAGVEVIELAVPDEVDGAEIHLR